MLVNNDAALARLDSPSNLINRLRSSSNSPRKDAMNLFGMNRKSMAAIKKIDEEVNEPIREEVKAEVKKEEVKEVKTFNPFAHKTSQLDSRSPTQNINIIPQVEQIVQDSESKLKLALAHDSALALLNDSVALLKLKLEDVKADKLPGVITAASKVVEGIRRERSEASKLNKDQEVHYHFYTPQQRKITDFQVIDVQGTIPSEMTP